MVLLSGGVGCSKPLLYSGHCMMRQFVGSSPMVGGEIFNVCCVVMNGGSEGTARGLHVEASA